MKPREAKSPPEESHDVTGKRPHVLCHTRSHDPGVGEVTQVGHSVMTSGDPPVHPYSHPEVSTPLPPRRPGFPSYVRPLRPESLTETRRQRTLNPHTHPASHSRDRPRYGDVSGPSRDMIRVPERSRPPRGYRSRRPKVPPLHLMTPRE